MSTDNALQFPQSHPLFGASLKVHRAETHVGSLHREISEFLGRSPYVVRGKTDPQTGDYVIRVVVNEDVPISLSPILGDAIHNLRAAFDLIACQVVALGGGNQAHAQFPIFSSSKKYFEKVDRYLGGAPQNAIDVIERFQPYHGGSNEALWLIHKLDILDKHRMIVPVGSAFSGIQFDVARGFQEAVEQGVISKLPDIPPLLLQPKERFFPLKDGAILMTVLRQAVAGFKERQDTKFVFDVAFGEGNVVDGEPVLSTLQKLIEFTNVSIKVLADELFS